MGKMDSCLFRVQEILRKSGLQYMQPGKREMAWWLGAFTALEEDPDSKLSTYTQLTRLHFQETDVLADSRSTRVR